MVGRVEDSSGEVLGSSWLIDPLRVVTAAHVVRHVDEVVIRWPESAETRAGRVEQPDEVLDLALVRLERPLFEDLLTLTDHSYGRFESFGYRHSGDFAGLYATGDMLGEVTQGDGTRSRRVIQLRSNTIDRGMSGAPVVADLNGSPVIVGTISGIWEADGLRDGDLAFAVPARFARSMFYEPIRPPAMSVVEERVLRAITFLTGDRFDDGAWGKSFRPPEGAFSEDNRSGVTHEGKRALSVTAWAGSALLAVAPTYAYDYVKQSIPFLMSSYIEQRGAFGHIHKAVSSTPFVEPTEHQIANPRHTASSARLLLELDGPSAVVARALRFLVTSSDPHGGWGEGPDLDANTLATAYVCSFLNSCLSRRATFASVFSPGEQAAVWDSLERSLEDGLDWLRRRQQDDGSWTYRRNETGSVLSPAYTAHVVAFAPDVLVRSDAARRRFVEFVERQVAEVEGIPDKHGGSASAARTLMVAYGLSKSTDPRLRRFGRVLGDLGTDALDATVTRDSVATIANIFYLLYVGNVAKHLLSDDLTALLAQVLRGMQMTTTSPGSTARTPMQWLRDLESGFGGDRGR